MFSVAVRSHAGFAPLRNVAMSAALACHRASPSVSFAGSAEMM